MEYNLATIHSCVDSLFVANIAMHEFHFRIRGQIRCKDRTADYQAHELYNLFPKFLCEIGANEIQLLQ